MSFILEFFFPFFQIPSLINFGRDLTSSNTLERYSPIIEIEKSCIPPKKAISMIMVEIPCGKLGLIILEMII